MSSTAVKSKKSAIDAGASKMPVVFMCAGISSRFGGKIKQFAQVGVNGETLIEVSINQAVKAGFGEIIFIVGNLTKEPFMQKFGDSYRGVPVKYALQEFDPLARDRPWGTTHAIVSALGLISGSFAICNGDDLYGEDAFLRVHDALVSKTAVDCIGIGYPLGSVLPESGTINRGIFRTNENGDVIAIEEMLNIEKAHLDRVGLTVDNLANMNLFGLTHKCILLLKERLLEFQSQHKGDRRAECYLPVELGNLAKSGKIKFKIVKTTGKWLGVTNPGDEDIVRAELLKDSVKKD